MRRLNKWLPNNVWTWLAASYRRLGWLWRLVLGTVLPMGLVFGLGAGCYLLFSEVLVDSPIWRAGATVPDGDIFKDVLQTVLVLAAIGIAVFGVGVYTILTLQVGRQVASNTERALRVAVAKQKIDSGLLYWHLSRLSDGTSEQLEHLRAAIKDTADAYVHQLTRLNEREWEVERLIVNCKNNWASFICSLDGLERVSDADRQAALDHVDYIARRQAQFPEDAVQIHDTVTTVRGRFRPGRP